MKQVVLITTGQPSINPRIVKEADVLQAAGFNVTVLYCYFIEWATKADETLLKNVEWKYKMVGGSPSRNKRLYLFTRLRFKVARMLNRYTGNKYMVAERSQARCYDELLKAARSIEANWYIGHNLGALGVCINAARFWKADAGFDFEDYHRGEDNTGDMSLKQRIEFLENKYVPHLKYISASSPLIKEKVAKDFPQQNKNMLTLLNCFPVSQQPAFRQKDEHDKTLQLFWFSQTIGINRGLEILIDALTQLNDPSIQLTLVGNCNEEFENYIKENAQTIKGQIHFHGTIPPGELPAFASNFDVGMAIEPVIPENRNICLTNKIFTYLLAGNAIILTDTAMQKKFNDEFGVGEVFQVSKTTALMEKINSYKSRSDLNVQRMRNYTLAQNSLNWERESLPLVHLLQKN